MTATPGGHPRLAVIRRLVTASVVAFLALVMTQPGAAQSGVFTIVDQTAIVPAEGTFRVVLAWSGSLGEGDTIGGVLYAPITDEDAVVEQPREAFAPVARVAVADLPRSEDGHLVFEVPLRTAGDGDEERIRVLEPGVFPLVLELRDAEGETRGTIRTNVIRLPTDAAEIEVLPLGVVVQIASAEGLTVDEATALLAGHPTSPITVVLGDGVLTQLENDVDLLARFRAALDGRPVVAAPQPALDPSAVAAVGRPDFYVTARDRTSARLDGLGLTPSTAVVTAADSLTRGGIDLLASLGVEVILDQQGRRGTTGTISGDRSSLTVVQIDRELTGTLEGASRSAARVGDLLATLSIRSATDRSPLVLGGSWFRGVTPATVDGLLDALEQPGLVAAVPLDVVADRAAPIPIRPDEQPAQDLLSVAATLETIETGITRYADFHLDGNDPPVTYRTRVLAALDPGLAPDERRRILDGIAAELAGRFETIDLPPGQAVTLAAQQAEIPLTIDNRATGTRRVLITFESDTIAVTQNNGFFDLPPGISTLDIELEARSLGQSPLDIRVFTPDGAVELASTRFGVRNTAIPGLGLLLSATALVFLLGWWIVSFTRSRALRGAAAEPAPSDEDEREPALTVADR